MPTIAAFAHKKSIGQPFVYPDNSLDYESNFLRMMFAVPTEPYVVDADAARALRILLILHADHEQNCSTSTVRMAGSSMANLYASISAGIAALWGPLHGGANQEVLEMLQHIADNGGDVAQFIDRAKDHDDPFRLMGFGHRVYKNYDPRARIIKEAADRVLAKLGTRDPLLDIALELERVALHDPYFVSKKLYPNVDFYSGLIYRALGFPANMFTVLFAIGRLPGWIAQWREMLARPRLADRAAPPALHGGTGAQVPAAVGAEGWLGPAAVADPRGGSRRSLPGPPVADAAIGAAPPAAGRVHCASPR